MMTTFLDSELSTKETEAFTEVTKAKELLTSAAKKMLESNQIKAAGDLCTIISYCESWNIEYNWKD